MKGVPERMPAAPAEGWANSHKGPAMDRRLPERPAWLRCAPIAMGAALWFGCAALAMDPEARPIPLATVGVGEAAGSIIVPVGVTLAALATAGWLWLRRRSRVQARPDGCITVLDRAVMGRGRALSLVRVGDRVVLVGESAQGFQRLAEFDADARPASALDARRLAS